MSSKNDTRIRDKIESLQPLSCGIVYGKEEAWDKLQSRMEQKPDKKIAVRYWLAAAAILLLFVCVIAVYNHPAKEVVSSKNEQLNMPTNNVEIAKSQMPGDVQQPEIMREQKTSAVVQKDSTHVTSVLAKNKKTEQSIIIITPSVEVLTKDNKVENKMAVTNAPAPIAPATRQMKTIHINELYNGGKEEQVTDEVAANAEKRIDLNKLPIVHINEVIHEEYEERKTLKENRSMFVQISFMQRGYKCDDRAYADEVNTSYNFLNIKPSTQN